MLDALDAPRVDQIQESVWTLAQEVDLVVRRV